MDGFGKVRLALISIPITRHRASTKTQIPQALKLKPETCPCTWPALVTSANENRYQTSLIGIEYGSHAWRFQGLVFSVQGLLLRCGKEGTHLVGLASHGLRLCKGCRVYLHTHTHKP